MKYLFIYAHPDDESYGAGGTIAKLINEGHDVVIITATHGDKGQVHGDARKLLETKTVAQLRLEEYESALKNLGVNKYEFLDFKDGELNNQDVWGDLYSKVRDIVNKYSPDYIITFDHTGWYFHLDHIAVSLAVTKYVNETHCVKALIFNYFKDIAQKDEFPYIYPCDNDKCFKVDVSKTKYQKLSAIKSHASQISDLETKYISDLKTAINPYEEFELVYGSVDKNEIF